MERWRAHLHLIQQADKDPLLRVEELKKVFRSGDRDLVLFENLSFHVSKGEMVAVVGQSGAGKSTLLHILGALDSASAGNVYCAHSQLNALSDDDASEFRNREIVDVWQFHYLLPEFTAQENVAMPLLIRGQAWPDAQGEASRWLREVGLESVLITVPENFPVANSALALARALITKEILLADEPTGDLDGHTAEAVFTLISRLHHDHQLTSFIATHNLGFARRCHRVMRLEQGRMQELQPESLPV